MSKHPVPWGGKNGIWYPLMWRILDLSKWWPPTKYMKTSRESRVYVDVYLGIMWFAEGVAAFLLHIYAPQTLIAYGVLILAGYRIIDITLVLLSELVRRATVYPYEWSSTNRKVLLVIFNALELFLLFGFVHYCRQILWLEDTDKTMGLAGLGDAVYFSVVTGTTLGYGDFSPHSTDNVGQVLVSIQPIVFVLVVVAMLAYARGRTAPEKSHDPVINKGDAEKGREEE